MRRSTKVGRPQRRLMIVLTAAIAGFAVAALAGLAVAKTTHSTVKSAHNSKLSETILVGSNGMTLYELRPETKNHLLCTSSTCFGVWPPLKVDSAKTKLHKAPGVHGKLGILHRKGFFQVTLNGRPLYHFSQDTAKGQANGQGLQTFGGTWHVVKTAGDSASGTTSSTTPSTTTTTPYSY